ncbi:MAG: DnaJ domain-containing protein [Bryobacterales bacterium]|nr:DnaJ domain-containing protein [Bryobacterales bacterium]
MMTHYDEFGVPPTASAEEIQKAHRGLARLLHPDQIQDAALRASAESQLKRLNAIYSLLMDPVRRQQYDTQIVRFNGPSGRMEVKRLTAPIPLPGRRLSQAFLTIAAAGVALGAGWWWGSTHQERTATTVAEAAPPAAEAKGAAARQERPVETASDARELRRLLNQVIQERDAAIARLHGLRGEAALPPTRHLPAASAVPGLAPQTAASATLAHPSPAAIEPAPSQTAAAAAMAPPSPTVPSAPAAKPRLAGTWIYAPPGGLAAPTDQYAAAYIELLLIEREDLLSGRYRARYNVPDRALSPDVEFYFEGAPPVPGGGEKRYTWRGTAGSKGEVQLRLRGDSSLSVNWFVSQLGRTLMLGSGTAVLVRRAE